jgi:hypothetical protein
MTLTILLSILGLLISIAFVLTTAYKVDKENFDAKSNITSRSLKSLAFIQFISIPIITYISVTQSEILYLFLYYATTLAISALGFFHCSKFFGYYASLFFSFIFLIFSISFGKNYFNQLNTGINIMYITSVMYAFSLNALLLTIYKPYFRQNTVPHFKNPFKLGITEKDYTKKSSIPLIQSINKVKVSSSFAIILIVFFFLYMFLVRPLYGHS